MTVTVEKLEQVYEDLLCSVKREVLRIKELSVVEALDLKTMEAADRILRGALEHYQGKNPGSEHAATQTEDLLKEFE